MKRFGWLGVVVLVCAGVAISALLTAIAFGGDLSDYENAPACVAGQHSSSTSCRETVHAGVTSTANGSPCIANFSGLTNPAPMTCDAVWSALKSGTTATVVLWHDDPVVVGDSAGSDQTESYPQATGSIFVVVGVIAGVLTLASGSWLLATRRQPHTTNVNSNAS